MLWRAGRSAGGLLHPLCSACSMVSVGHGTASGCSKTSLSPWALRRLQILGIRHGPALAGLPGGGCDGRGLASAGGLHLHTAWTGRQPAAGVGGATAARLFVEPGCKPVGDSDIFCGFLVSLSGLRSGWPSFSSGWDCCSLVCAVPWCSRASRIPAALLLHDVSTPAAFHHLDSVPDDRL